MKDVHLREKIGQMLIAGFEGTSITPDLKMLIRDYHIGGVILFKHNSIDPHQVKNLIRNINDFSLVCGNKLPPFISIDHEGGRVWRLMKPFTHFPPFRLIGALGDETVLEDVGKIMGMELSSVGFNMNFAPVLDVATYKKNPVIWDRALSDDPEVVSRFGSVFVKGMESQGIIAVAKHFPGHGNTRADSHKILPVVEDDVKRLKHIELIPFADAIQNGIRVVMTAHVRYEKIDNSYPATLSRKILRGILRENLSFNGLIISDDLAMKAVADNFSLKEIAERGLEAGIDLFLLSGNIEDQMRLIEEIYRTTHKNGYEGERFIEEAWRRISSLKYDILMSKSPAPGIEEVKKKKEYAQILKRLRNIFKQNQETASFLSE